MTIFRNAVFTAAIAGLFAGIVLAALQSIATVPLVMEAETYEASAPSRDHGGHSHSGEEDDAAAGRFIRNVLTNAVSGIGFALILVVASELAGGVNGWRQGLMWGLAGFAVFTLAPGLGLPPELPAMPAADLAARQSWWIATVFLTAGGLALIVFWASLPLAMLGVAMMIAPHIWGAPLPDTFESPVPEALHHRFVVAVTVTNLLFWLVLGMATGLVRDKFNIAPHEPANRFA